MKCADAVGGVARVEREKRRGRLLFTVEEGSVTQPDNGEEEVFEISEKDERNKREVK